MVFKGEKDIWMVLIVRGKIVGQNSPLKTAYINHVIIINQMVVPNKKQDPAQ